MDLGVERQRGTNEAETVPPMRRELNGGGVVMQAILNRVKYPSRFYATKVWVAMLVALTLCFCATVASAQWPPVVMPATTPLYAQSSVAPGRVAVAFAARVARVLLGWT